MLSRLRQMLFQLGRAPGKTRPRQGSLTSPEETPPFVGTVALHQPLPSPLRLLRRGLGSPLVGGAGRAERRVRCGAAAMHAPSVPCVTPPSAALPSAALGPL